MTLPSPALSRAASEKMEMFCARGRSVAHAADPDRVVRLILWAALSVVFTAVIIRYSWQHGRLSVPMTYDDVTYALSGLDELRRFYDSGFAGVAANYLKFPPHAPLSTLLAWCGFALLGVHDWAPYAANALVIFGTMLFVDHFIGRARLGVRLAAQLLVLSIPVSAMAVYELRPDAAVGMLTAAFALLLLGRPLLRASAWRLCFIGALLGLALWSKPSVFPATLLLGGLALVLATARERLLRGTRARPAALARAWLCVLAPALLVPLPHFLAGGREVFHYIWDNTFGIHREAWAQRLGWRENLAWYATGPGGQTMLGNHLWLLAGLLLAGGAAWLIAPLGRRQRSRRATWIGAFIVIVLGAYALPTANWHKQWFFGATFDYLLIFGAVRALGMLARRATLWELPGQAVSARPAAGCSAWRRATAGVALAALVVLGLLLARWPEPFGTRGDPVTAARNRIVETVYDNIRDRAQKRDTRVWLTMAGNINADTLLYLAAKDGREFFFRGDGLATLVQQSAEMDRADDVLATDPDNPEVFAGFPGTRLLADSLDLIRRRRDFVLVAAFPTHEGKHYYLFERVDRFGGWESATGLGEVESYPWLGLPAVRWGLGPATHLRLTDRPAGRYVLEVEWKSRLTPQRLKIRLDGRTIAIHDFPALPAFRPVEYPLWLSAGRHELELNYSTWEPTNPAKPTAVAFSRLRVLPADAAEGATQLPRE